MAAAFHCRQVRGLKYLTTRLSNASQLRFHWHSKGTMRSYLNLTASSLFASVFVRGKQKQLPENLSTIQQGRLQRRRPQ